MRTFDKTVAVNGLVNLGTLLLANGFTGHNALKTFILGNKTATDIRFITSDSGTTAPSSPATDGSPVNNETYTLESGSDSAVLDAGTTWLYTASSINVRIVAVSVGF